MHLTRDQSILAPNFTVEVVHDDHIEHVDVDLNFYRGFLEGRFVLHYDNFALFIKLTSYSIFKVFEHPSYCVGCSVALQQLFLFVFGRP